MANSYQMPSVYNGHHGQYAPSPYFPPSTTNGPPPPFSPSVQQPPALTAQASNQKRFDANAHAPTPPALPFQLPPNLDLEELKNHIATHGYPPPPPPLLPPQAFSSPFGPNPGPNSYPVPAPIPQQHQQYANAQGPRPPFPTTPTPNANHAFLTAAREEKGSAQPVDKPQDLYPYFQPHPPAQIPGLDGTTRGLPFPANSSPTSASQHRLVQPNHAAGAENHSMQTRSGVPLQEASVDERHEKARAALADMFAAGITYQNLVDEGINAIVLEKLFGELGVDPKAVPTTAALPSRSAESATQPNQQATTQDVPRQATATPQPEILDRKDRIAQLLAARKGQMAPSAKSSQSASPVQANEPKPTPVSNPVPSLSRSWSADALQSAPAQPQDPGTEMTQPKFDSLPTPVREEIRQQGVSIPGLFMTSADQLDQSEAEPRVERQDEGKPLKRSAEPMPSHSMPQPKRQFSRSKSPINVPVAQDEPMLSGAAVVPPATLSTTSPATGVTAHAPEPNPQATRSKVNSERLKNRMAKLRADLIAKNQRKKSLQDGMPVLDAEVDQTRQRLADSEARLVAVRKTIRAKEAELDEVKSEQNTLCDEIDRLRRQLADGESGQKHFSNELDQLNDQIVADEKESQGPPQETAQPPRRDTLVDTEAPHEPRPFTNADQAVVVSMIEADADQVDEARPVSDQQQPYEAVRTSVPAPPTDEVDPQGGDEALPDSSHKSLINAATSVSEEGLIEESDDDRMSIDEASDQDSNGSASMSDSGSDYDPAISSQNTQPDTMDEGDEYEPADGTPYQPSTEADNDDYEPAEQVDVLNVDSLDDLRRRPEAPASSRTPPSADHADAAPGSPPDDAVHSSAFPTRPGSVEPPLSSVLPSNPDLSTLPPPSDLLQPPRVSPGSEDEPSAPRFVPYHSPLASLKSFRFHPQFNELVKDGYRSLTYSNRIDPTKPICQSELEGHMCTDVNCDDQHFGSMVLSDDKILVQMSSANDIKDKALRDQYLLGLKKVIATLREQGVREFAEVANALSQYRREWQASQDGIVT